MANLQYKIFFFKLFAHLLDIPGEVDHHSTCTLLNKSTFTCTRTTKIAHFDIECNNYTYKKDDIQKPSG